MCIYTVYREKSEVFFLVFISWRSWKNINNLIKEEIFIYKSPYCRSNYLFRSLISIVVLQYSFGEYSLLDINMKVLYPRTISEKGTNHDCFIFWKHWCILLIWINISNECFHMLFIFGYKVLVNVKSWVKSSLSFILAIRWLEEPNESNALVSILFNPFSLFMHIFVLKRP